MLTMKLLTKEQIDEYLRKSRIQFQFQRIQRKEWFSIPRYISDRTILIKRTFVKDNLNNPSSSSAGFPKGNQDVIDSVTVGGGGGGVGSDPNVFCKNCMLNKH